MKNLYKIVSNFLRDEEGLTIVEYAVAGALISVAVVTAFTTLGTNIGNAITSLANTVGGGGGG